MASSQSKNNCFCAFCKSPRRIYRKRSISFTNVVASALASVVFMFAIWHSYDARVMIVFVVCLAISEAFVKFRWRLSVPCGQCGFDPLLYIKHPDLAAEKVKARLDVRKQDPKYLFARPLDLARLPADRAKALQNKDKKGQLISRQL